MKKRDINCYFTHFCRFFNILLLFLHIFCTYFVHEIHLLYQTLKNDENFVISPAENS